MDYQELLRRRPWIRNYDPDVPYEVRFPRIPIHYILRHQAVVTRTGLLSGIMATRLVFGI